MQSNYESSFRNYIFNNRVVIVGPSTRLTGLGLGNKLDNEFDIVVKTNGMVFIRNNLAKDYGQRIDILYVNIEFVNTYNVTDVLSQNKDIKYCCFKSYKNINPDTLSVSSRPISIFNDTNLFSSAPLMGSLILNDILACSPLSIYVTGFDFYSLDYFYAQGYREGIIKNKNKFKVGSISTSANLTNAKKFLHNVNEDFKYLHQLVNKYNGLILVDEYISQLFFEYEKTLI